MMRRTTASYFGLAKANLRQGPSLFSRTTTTERAVSLAKTFLVTLSRNKSISFPSSFPLKILPEQG
jgi:hypothetical protein